MKRLNDFIFRCFYVMMMEYFPLTIVLGIITALTICYYTK